MEKNQDQNSKQLHKMKIISWPPRLQHDNGSKINNKTTIYKFDRQ